MGFQAVLPGGKVVAPAVEVLLGELTPQQANERYRGTEGLCPDCMALRKAQAGTDNPTIQSALSVADLHVSYRSASIDDRNRMTRVMHFAHRPGFWQQGDQCSLCRSGLDLLQHAAAVKVIGLWAEKQWAGCSVTAEMKVIVRGTPPALIRPDVAIHDSQGKPVACIEYQRSAESFPSFKERDRLRLQEFPVVIWFFAGSTYARSGDHRDYLAAHGRRFYRCHVLPEGRLEYEPGQPRKPVPSAQRVGKLTTCSESALVRALEDRDKPRANRPKETRIDPGLAMRRAGTRNGSPHGIPGAMPSIPLQVGDLAEKWSTVERRWLPGWVVVAKEDGGYVIYNGTGKLTKAPVEVRPADEDDAPAIAAKVKWEAQHGGL
jgi:hypothetical protein